MAQTQTFKCRKCNTVKETEEFRGDSRMPHGITYECKECRRERERVNGEYLNARLRGFKKRKGDAVMSITVAQLEQLLTRHSCTYCGGQLTDENATIDHVYALSNGYGSANIVENIVQACRSCNSSKANDHVYDFYRRSKTFTDELWTKFVREYGERLLNRKLTDIEVEQLKRNFADEASDLRKNAARKEAATG